jgi:hypothetical protein
MHSRRGAALVIVIVAALICSIASYIILFIAMSEAWHSRFFRERNQARHAAEAALVIGMQKLWEDPAYCGGAVTVNTPAGAVPIPVTVSDCDPADPKTLSVTVNY